MALRIVKSTDPIVVKQIITTIYAPPGIGKTSLGFTADKPLLLDFDHGVHRSANRGDSVHVEVWDDVASIAESDLKNYRTLVLDTAGRALDILSTAIIKDNPKMGRSGGSLTLPGFGVLKDRFKSYTTLIRSFGLDIVLLVHMDEQRSGDEVIERLDATGSSRNEIYKASDLMGRLKIVNGERVLNFNPTDVSFGKNPAGLPPLPVPRFSKDPHFLGRVITDTKAALNKLTEAQAEAAAELATWKDKYDQGTTADEFNDLIVATRDHASDAVRENAGRLLVKIAKEKGLAWDGEHKKFLATEKEHA